MAKRTGTVLHDDGMEAGDLSGFTGSSGDTAVLRGFSNNAVYGGRFTNDGNAYTNLSPDQRRVRVSLWHCLRYAGSNAVVEDKITVFRFFFTNIPDTVCSLYATYKGGVGDNARFLYGIRYIDEVPDEHFVDTTGIELHRWHYVYLDYYAGSGGEIRLWVDNVLVIELTKLDNNSRLVDRIYWSAWDDEFA